MPRLLPVGLTAALILLFVLAQAPFLDDPYIWDGLYYIASSARDLYLHPGSLVPDGPWDNGHPPLLYWLLAGAWMITGPHLQTSHLVMLLFGASGLLLTYALGRSLAGPRAGFLAALFLAVHPLFFYQTSTLSLDVPVTAFALAALLAGIRGRWALAILAASAMVLTRESAAAFLPALALVVLLGRDEGSPIPWKGAAALVLVPGLVLAAWYAAHYQVTGWLLYEDASRDVKLGLGDLIWPFPYEVYRRSLRPFIRDHGQWALGLLALAGLVANLAGRRGGIREPRGWAAAVGWAGVVLPMGILTAIMSFYLPRYLLPALPFACILAGGAASRAGRLGPILAGAALVPLLLAHEGEPIPGYESNRGHLPVIEANRQASRWIQENHPEARVFVRWPLWQQLCDPIYGYVTRPVKVVVPGNTEEFKGFCAPGAYIRIPREQMDRFGAGDFDLVWMSPNDVETGRYRWLEERVSLSAVGEVEHGGMRIRLFAPGGERDDAGSDAGPPAE